MTQFPRLAERRQGWLRDLLKSPGRSGQIPSAGVLFFLQKSGDPLLRESMEKKLAPDWQFQQTG